jgi:hypothetical protein
MVKSRIQQKKQRRSKRKQLKYGGGYDKWEVTYVALCEDNITAEDLFDMINTGLHAMADGRTPYILGTEFVFVEKLYNEEREAYRVRFMIHFPQSVNPNEIKEWEIKYLNGIRERDLNDAFVPKENSFFYEPVLEDDNELPEYLSDLRDVRDV